MAAIKDLGDRAGKKTPKAKRRGPKRDDAAKGSTVAKGAEIIPAKPKLSKDEIASRKKAAAQHAAPMLRSERVIRFIHQLKIPSGIGIGTPFRLREWQIDFLRAVYDKIDPETGKRQIREALLSMARKNGKTALAAALVLVHLVGPESTLNGEVYSAASDRSQAAHIYKMASQMIRLDEELSEMCRCLDSVKRIAVRSTGSFYQALVADAHRLHGYNPHFVVYDELAQAKNSVLYDVLSTSFGAQEEGLMLVISTQSEDPTHVMQQLVDNVRLQEEGILDNPYFYGKVYEVPVGTEDKPGPDIFDPAFWHLANPALNDFKTIKQMEATANKAKAAPGREPAFRNLELNQPVSASARLVNGVDWRACAGKVPEEILQQCTNAYLGLDLSGKRDLTAAVAAFEIPEHLQAEHGKVAARAWHWTPSENVAERERKDGARYQYWSQQKHMEMIPGRTIDLDFVAVRLGEILRQYPNIRRIAYDRFYMPHLISAIERNGLSTIIDTKGEKVTNKVQLVEHGQSYRDMSPAVESLETAIINHELRHGGNPVLTYCVSNLITTADATGNRKFDKRATTKRIDGGVALALALNAKNIGPGEIKGQSVYEKRGVLVI